MATHSSVLALRIPGMGPPAWWAISPSPSRRGRRMGPELSRLPMPHPGQQHGGRGTRAGAGPAGRGWSCLGSVCVWGTDSGVPAPLEEPGVPCVQGNRQRGPRPTGGARGPVRPGERRATHSSTSRLNCFCRLPRNSPIICRLRPLRCSRKWATPTGVSGTKPRSMRYWTPFSGFLGDERQAQMGVSAPAPLRLRSTWSCPSLSPPPGALGPSRPRVQPGPVRGVHSGPVQHALAARGQAGWPTPRGPPRRLSPHAAPRCPGA